MNKFSGFITSHPHLIITLLALLVVIFLKLPFWVFPAFLAAYGILMYLTHLPSAIGMTGYFIDAFLRKPKAAIPLYRYAYNHKSRNLYGLMSYGLYLMREAREYEKAREVFEYTLTVAKPESMMTKYARQDYAISLWKCGRLDDAIAVMETMLKDYEFFSLDFYTTLGYFYIEAGEYEKAEEFTNKALDEDEAHGPAYDNLGQIAFRQGRYEDAKELLLKALDLKETMADSKYYLGLIYEQEGDYESALNYFSAAHKSKITGMNTIEREVVDAKYNEYMNQ